VFSAESSAEDSAGLTVTMHDAVMKSRESIAAALFLILIPYCTIVMLSWFNY
jgi:hypothetical protein